MSGGVPKRIQISRTQRNTYCKAGGKDKVQGLVLCSGKRSQKAMCDYIKKRTNTKLSPYFSFISTNANITVEGGYTIYDFTSNGQFGISEQLTVEQVNSMKRCGNRNVAGPGQIEYFMVGGGGAGAAKDLITLPIAKDGGGGAGGVVRTGSVDVHKQIAGGNFEQLNIVVATGGVNSPTGPGGNGSASSIVGTIISINAPGGGGGYPNQNLGLGVGGSNADYAGGLEAAGGEQSGGGAGSAQDGFQYIAPPPIPQQQRANGGSGTPIPANYGITGFFGAGGGAGTKISYSAGPVPPPYFGLGGNGVTTGGGNGGGAGLAPPVDSAATPGEDGYGGGGGGGGGILVSGDAGKGGTGRVIIRYKHI